MGLKLIGCRVQGDWGLSRGLTLVPFVPIKVVFQLIGLAALGSGPFVSPPRLSGSYVGISPSSLSAFPGGWCKPSAQVMGSGSHIVLFLALFL